jgi:hypothetical protein
VIPIITPTFFPPRGYFGPGDIASASVWWGLRAYSNAKIGTNAVRLRASGDNAESDFVTLANGGLNLTAISAFQVAHGGSLFVTKLYDQTGGGQDAAQATAANQPAFTLNGLGSLPVMTFVNANQTELDATTNTLSYPFTVSMVFNNIFNSAEHRIFINDASTILIQLDTSGGNDIISMNAGSQTALVTCVDSVWHAVQSVFNGGSSSINVDGALTTGLNPSNNAPRAIVNLGGNTGGGGGLFFNGAMTEFGFWASAHDSGTQANLTANQRAYWGF